MDAVEEEDGAVADDEFVDVCCLCLVIIAAA